MATKLFNFTSERSNALRKREDKENKEKLEKQKTQEENANKFYDRESQLYLDFLKSNLDSKYLPYVFNKSRSSYYDDYDSEIIRAIMSESCQNIKDNFDKSLRAHGLREFDLDIVDKLHCKIDINTTP